MENPKMNLEQYAEFLEHHRGEILGLYRDKYYRNGGWNGMMDAINDVENRYNIELEEDADTSEVIDEFMKNR